MRQNGGVRTVKNDSLNVSLNDSASDTAVAKPSGKRRAPKRGFLGGLRASVRYLFDGKAPVVGKLILVAALGYMALPVDLLPDAVPVVGWLDDIGVFGVAWAIFSRYLTRWEEAGPAATPALPAMEIEVEG